MSRDKGKKGELALMHVLRDTYGFDVRRGYVFHNEPDIVGLYGIHCEVKTCSRMDALGWMSQAEIASEKHQDGLPTVFFRLVSKTQRGLPWLVMMRFTDWQSMGGKDFENDHRASFRQGVYESIEGKEAVRFWRSGRELVLMELKDWAGLYANWQFPFTEEEDVSDD